MNPTFSLDDAQTSLALTETMSWCRTQEIVAVAKESEGTQERRKLGEKAAELSRRAFLERSRLWNGIFRRDYTKNPLWRRGQELYRQAEIGSIPPPLAAQLRTPRIAPTQSVAECRTDSQRRELVRSVVSRRSEALMAEMRVALDKAVDNLGGGRLLLYVPEENLACGAAQYASDGFFDVDNTPPWDTWVAYLHSTLLSWVPPQLLQLAQRGIDANPECCIRWIDG